MNGYDLDDTLAKVEFSQASVRGLATVYSQAKVLYRPEGRFVVITARTHSTSALKTATLNWLQDNYKNFVTIRYVPSGSEAAVGKAKAAIINAMNLDSYTDNNRDVLKAIAEYTDVPLYLLSAGHKTRVS